MELGKLYIVATPIGNLEDITFRAVETLKNVNLILCEDTRQTQKLCQHYQIKTPLLSYHQHSKNKKQEKIFQILKQNRDLALVSDAGTPGISDPGNKLIEFLLDKEPDFKIIPIPGPAALTAALSISGFPSDKFLFWGFLPQKKGRNKIFQEIEKNKSTSVFYESPYRIFKTLTELNNFPKLKNRRIFIGRELTKKFETIYRGKVEEIIKKINQKEFRGEFVVIIT